MKKDLDILTFSHLRWNFVFQRPQHLLSRAARSHRVFFWEEPVYGSGSEASLKVTVDSPSGVVVITPQLPTGIGEAASQEAQRRLLRQFVSDRGNNRPIAWYYTPLALNFSRDLPTS